MKLFTAASLLAMLVTLAGFRGLPAKDSVVPPAPAKDVVYPKSANGWHYLNSIAAEWYELSENKGNYYTFTPCAGMPDKIIIKKWATPVIQYEGGTCGSQCRIVKIRKLESQEEGYGYQFTLGNCTSMCTGDPLTRINEVKMLYEPGPDEYILVKNECVIWTGNLVTIDRHCVPAKNYKNFPNKQEKCP